nr:hypothetical protein [Kibdelosporangium sp. MJ126-NF4]
MTIGPVDEGIGWEDTVAGGLLGGFVGDIGLSDEQPALTTVAAITPLATMPAASRRTSTGYVVDLVIESD